MERITKTLIVLLLTPFLIALMLILAALMVLLPLVVFIRPATLKFTDKETN